MCVCVCNFVKIRVIQKIEPLIVGAKQVNKVDRLIIVIKLREKSEKEKKTEVVMRMPNEKKKHWWHEDEKGKRKHE